MYDAQSTVDQALPALHGVLEALLSKPRPCATRTHSLAIGALVAIVLALVVAGTAVGTSRALAPRLMWRAWYVVERAHTRQPAHEIGSRSDGRMQMSCNKDCTSSHHRSATSSHHPRAFAVTCGCHAPCLQPRRVPQAKRSASSSHHRSATSSHHPRAFAVTCGCHARRADGHPPCLRPRRVLQAKRSGPEECHCRRAKKGEGCAIRQLAYGQASEGEASGGGLGRRPGGAA